jgi:hypothetical protein
MVVFFDVTYYSCFHGEFQYRGVDQEEKWNFALISMLECNENTHGRPPRNPLRVIWLWNEDCIQMRVCMRQSYDMDRINPKIPRLSLLVCINLRGIMPPNLPTYFLSKKKFPKIH